MQTQNPDPGNNDPGNKYQVCARCGKPKGVGDKFCASCGYANGALAPVTTWFVSTVLLHKNLIIGTAIVATVGLVIAIASHLPAPAPAKTETATDAQAGQPARSRSEPENPHNMSVYLPPPGTRVIFRELSLNDGLTSQEAFRKWDGIEQSNDVITRVDAGQSLLKSGQWQTMDPGTVAEVMRWVRIGNSNVAEVRILGGICNRYGQDAVHATKYDCSGETMWVYNDALHPSPFDRSVTPSQIMRIVKLQRDFMNEYKKIDDDTDAVVKMSGIGIGHECDPSSLESLNNALEMASAIRQDAEANYQHIMDITPDDLDKLAKLYPGLPGMRSSIGTEIETIESEASSLKRVKAYDDAYCR